MKKVLTWFLVVVSTLILVNPLVAAEKGFWGVEQGHIKKKSSVDSKIMRVDTEEDIYFKQYGWVTATVRTTRTTNQMVKGEQVDRYFRLQEGSKATGVNLDTMEGHTIEIPMMKQFQQMSEKEREQFGEQMANALGGNTEADGEEVIAGKKCQIFKTTIKMGNTAMVTREWRWKNIALKTVSKGMGTTTTEEAILVDTDTKVPEDKFKLPKGVTITQ